MEKSIGRLGFGMMRLPSNGSSINIKRTEAMVDKFLEHGYNYFDTAWAYGKSEEATRKALVERYDRKDFLLATKISAWIKCNNASDAISQFNQSLENTKAGYFDYYLLHNLGFERTRLYEDFGLFDWVQERKKEGIVKHVGFSFHGTASELDEILTRHPEIEFVQLQINYADWLSPVIQSKACYDTARKHNKKVVIMEPVKGGLLATPPQSVMDIFKAQEPKSSAASWALRFASNLDGVLTVLSGMSNMKQMLDNLNVMDNFTGFSPEQLSTIEKAQKALDEVQPLIPCTKCGYCNKACPKNIGIPESFTVLNTFNMYGNKNIARRQEMNMVGGQNKKHADSCIGCGACEKACPQHISIRENLKVVKEKILS